MDFWQPGFSGIVAIDASGSIVWYYHSAQAGHSPQALALKPGGNVVYVDAHGFATSNGLVEIDPLGREVDRLAGPCPPLGPIRDVHLSHDGRIVYLSRYILKGKRSAPQEADTVGMWDQTSGEARIVWNVADFISPTDRTAPDSDLTLQNIPMWGGCERDDTVQDWSRGSSVFMADDGSLLVSLRNLDQIVLVEPDFRSIRWRLGGPGGDFVFPEPRDGFYRQHSASLLPNGNVLLFDNGNLRPREEGGQYSRALELRARHGHHDGNQGLGIPAQPGHFRRLLLQRAQACERQHACCLRLERGGYLLQTVPHSRG